MSHEIALDRAFAGNLGLLALADEGLCLLHVSKDNSFDVVENPPAGWPRGIFEGSDFKGFTPVVADSLRRALASMRDNPDPICTEFEMTEDGGTRLYRARFLPGVEMGTGVTIVVCDITERRDRERAFETLQREVSHRSKNLLAIIQSIAMQTAQHSDAIDDYLVRFRGRLHALSSTQDLITDNHWHGAGFMDLVTAQLSNLGLSRTRDVNITGTDTELGPNAALHVGLAVHELGSNHFRHAGKTSKALGPVILSGEFHEHPVFGPTYEIVWRENWSELDLVPANEPRFGTLMLERVVPISVSGSARYGVEGDHLVYALNIPLSHIRL